MELVGIIPAAGRATRLGDIPGSKEILPVHINGQKKAISEVLINSYKLAGIQKVYFIIREGKYDIMEHYKNGDDFGVHISYLMMRHPHGVPFTLNEASPFVDNCLVALGFPDMYIQPENYFKVLKEVMEKKSSDLILALFPVEKKHKWDMVELNNQGEVTDIVIKPKDTHLQYGWSGAIWGPRFTKYLQSRVTELINNHEEGRIPLENGEDREIYPGDLFLEFIKQGFKVDSYIFENSECIDLGTKDDLKKFQ